MLIKNKFIKYAFFLFNFCPFYNLSLFDNFGVSYLHGEECSYFFSGDGQPNTSPTSCTDGTLTISGTPNATGGGDSYGFNSLTINPANNINYLNLIFKNTESSKISDFWVNTSSNPNIKMDWSFINADILFKFKVNNLNNYTIDNLNFENSSITFISTADGNGDSMTFRVNNMSIKNSTFQFFDSDGTSITNQDIYLSVNNINMDTKEKTGTISLLSMAHLTIQNAYLDEIIVTGVNALGDIHVGKSLFVNKVRIGSIYVEDGGILDVVTLDVSNLYLGNGAAFTIRGSNLTSASSYYTDVFTNDNEINIVLKADEIVKLNIYAENNTNNIYLNNGIIKTELDGAFVVDNLFATNGTLLIGNYSPSNGNPTNNNGYSVNYAELNILKAEGITNLTGDQSLIIYQELGLEALHASGESDLLVMDGAFGTIGTVDNDLKSGNLILKNKAKLTISDFANRFNSIKMYDSMFQYNGTQALSVGTLYLDNSTFNANSDLSIGTSIYMNNSTLKASKMKINGDVNVVLGSVNLNEYVFQVDLMEIRDARMSLSLSNTADIKLGKTLTYNIIDSQNDIIITQGSEYIELGLPSNWINAELVYSNNNQDLQLEANRYKSFTEILDSSSFDEDKLFNAYILAGNIDNIMNNYSSVLTEGLKKIITSLDLDTQNNYDMVANAMISLLPVRSIVYVSGIDSANTSSLNVVASNSLEKNYFNKTNKFWFDFELGNREGLYHTPFSEGVMVSQFGYNLYLTKNFNMVFSSGVSKSNLNADSYDAIYDGFNIAVGASYVSDSYYYINILALSANYTTSSTRVDFAGNTGFGDVDYSSNTIQFKLGKDFVYSNNAIKLNNYLFVNLTSVNAPEYEETGTLAYAYEAVKASVAEYGYNIGLSRIYNYQTPDTIDTSQKIDLNKLSKLRKISESKLLISANVAFSYKTFSSTDTIVKFAGLEDFTNMTFYNMEKDKDPSSVVISPNISFMYIGNNYSYEISYTLENAHNLYVDNRLRLNITYKL